MFQSAVHPNSQSERGMAAAIASVVSHEQKILREMAAAAAAVVSLEQKILRLLNSSQSEIGLPKSELESICEDLSLCQSFLQTFISGSLLFSFGSKTSTIGLRRLERVELGSWQNKESAQIADLAKKIEYTIESYTSKRNRSESESCVDVNLAFAFFEEIVKFKSKTNSLTKTMKFKSKTTSLAKTMKSEKEKRKTNNIQRSSSSFVAESDTTKMAGSDDKLEKLMERVFWGCHRIISIVGMAGIGKTTLAKEFFYNPICRGRFRHRLFLTVGPRYESRQFLLLALGKLGLPMDEMCGKKDEELKDYLLSCLYGKRCLIVLDDIWDTQVWHEIQILFQDVGRNGGRVTYIMTTRLRHIAGRDSYEMLVPFLNDEESWDLLRKMVFTRDQESDHQLEKNGRKIAKNCEGLPLAIVEVGKLLCKIERTVESWKEIAEREDPLVITIDDGTPISNTLSLSYKMLPQHLKSCFLYMGVFPKDYEIRTSKLIRLWVSERFIEKTSSSSSKSLEKIAEEYLLDLVSRNLVLVCKRSTSGGIKTCRIHFVFRNMCISKARNKKLFHVIKKYPNNFPEGQRGLCFHNNSVLGFKQVQDSFLKSDSDPRSLLCFGLQHPFPLRLYLNFPSLRVLDAVSIRFYKLPHQVVELVELRYLAITYDAEIPPSISRLCNLEVLIVRRHHESLKYSEAPVYLPMEIWKLRKLRHLQCRGYDLRDPSKEYGFDGLVTLENLSTLSGVSAHSCNQGVLERIPMLMKLVIRIESPDNTIEIFDLFRHLRLLKRLESFKCVVANPTIGSEVFANAPYFPTNIRKITLSGCGFSWCDMTYIASIPSLEVLKLRRCAFQGAVWLTNKYEFVGLKVLLLEDLDIEHWITNPRHFPNLRCLIIRHCYKLRVIPRRKECYSTLENIEVDDCSPSLVISALQIQEEIQKMFLESKFPELRFHHSWDEKRLKP